LYIIRYRLTFTQFIYSSVNVFLKNFLREILKRQN
jgi:hypothetical protein